MVVTGGQRNDGSMLQAVIDVIRVPQPAGHPGRPRTTPDAVPADRAYPSRANREHLRDRRITAVIPSEDRPRQRPQTQRFCRRSAAEDGPGSL